MFRHTAKLDVIHKTESIATSPEEDRATARIRIQNFVKVGAAIAFQGYASGQPDSQTDGLITILRTPTGAE